jgi:predicted aspartyl protease
MGLTFVKVKVGNPANGRRADEEQSLVDSGAVYSLVPEPVLRKLEIEPHSTREFVLAAGDVIQRRPKRHR